MTQDFIGTIQASPFLTQELKNLCIDSFNKGSLSDDQQQRILSAIQMATPSLEGLRGEALSELVEESVHAYYGSIHRASEKRKKEEEIQSNIDLSSADSLLQKL